MYRFLTGEGQLMREDYLPASTDRRQFLAVTNLQDLHKFDFTSATAQSFVRHVCTTATLTLHSPSLLPQHFHDGPPKPSPGCAHRFHASLLFLSHCYL
jgi:hypothetical protein